MQPNEGPLLRELFSRAIDIEGVTGDVLLADDDLDEEDIVAKAVKYAPAGGISLAGKKFTGGQFIPAADLEAASPEEKAELKQRGGKGSPERVPKGERHTNPASTYSPDPAAVNQKTGLADRARVGVPALSTPPPPADIPRLPNLDPEQREVESRFADAYLANPDGMAEKYLKALRKRKVGVEPNVFATDDVKALNPDWNPGKVRPGEPLDKATKKAMARYNTAVHQTANALAKRAFLTYLDRVVARNPPEKRTVLVTQGGVAAGKGSSLARAADPDSPYAGSLPAAAHVGAVWDAAGEQNATENEWVLEECKKRGIKPIFAYVHANPKDTWDAPDRGVIRRAARKGRMVDARLFADSYAQGAKNMHAFHQKYEDDPRAEFIFVDNRQKGSPKLMDGVPPEALSWDVDAIYRDAVASLEAHRSDLPKAMVEAGLAGEKIWGTPERKAWDESRHPRGQSGNKGEFRPGGASAKDDLVASKESAGSAATKLPAQGTRLPRTEEPALPERFGTTAKGHVLIGADVQRWCEGTNEPAVAKVVKGKALPDNEPIDVILPPPPAPSQHGLELKTMVSNTHRQIRMKPDAKARKRAWRRTNKVPVHTVVIDDTAVYNALGPGKHDLSKRRVYYRRGFGSFKVDRMHEVAGGLAGLPALISTPTRRLPPGAWKPKPKPIEGT